MIEKVNKINSPLTIIAIFAALAEVNATIAIGLIDNSLHHIFIWFVIGFPTLLVILFFITLNYNTKVMYSPSDFREDKHFIDSLYGQNLTLKKPTNSESQQTKLVEELEKKLSKTIEDKLHSTPQNSISKEELENLLESQKEEIRKFTEISANQNLGFEVPAELKASFIRWISYPAYIPIIYAIIDSGIYSVSGLKEIENNYNLPVRWDKHGLRGLKDILIVDNDQIIFKEGIEEPLRRWININRSTIKSIISEFEGDTDERKALNDKARNKSQNLIIA